MIKQDWKEYVSRQDAKGLKRELPHRLTRVAKPYLPPTYVLVKTLEYVRNNFHVHTESLVPVSVVHNI